MHLCAEGMPTHLIKEKPSAKQIFSLIIPGDGMKKFSTELSFHLILFMSGVFMSLYTCMCVLYFYVLFTSGTVFIHYHNRLGLFLVCHMELLFYLDI